MILVTGATGNAGGAVVRACAAADQRTRALVRDSRAVLPSGVEAVPGDLNQPDTLRPALADVSAIFLLSGYEELETTLAEARAARSRADRPRGGQTPGRPRFRNGMDVPTAEQFEQWVTEHVDAFRKE